MSTIPQLPLKATFFSHLVLTVWSIQGSWLPISYLYYNTFFLVILLWAIYNHESEEPLFMGLVLNMASILLDIISIAVFCPHSPSNHGQFSIAMSIINLVLRPFTCVILFRIMNERGGIYNNFGVSNLGNYFGSGPSGSASRGPYENIDQPIPQSVPQNNIDPYSPQHKGPHHMVPTSPSLP